MSPGFSAFVTEEQGAIQEPLVRRITGSLVQLVTGPAVIAAFSHFSRIQCFLLYWRDYWRDYPRMTPPRFSLAAEMHAWVVEEESYRRCILEIHKVFRTVFSPLVKGRDSGVVQISEFYPPIIDFAVSVYDAEVEGIMEVDLPKADRESFLIAGAMMAPRIAECLLPNCCDGHLGGPWENHGTRFTAHRLLWAAWCLFDHPFYDEIEPAVHKLTELIDGDAGWALFHSIQKRLALRQTYWIAEFTKAVGGMLTPIAKYGSNKVPAATTVATERDFVDHEVANEVSEVGHSLPAVGDRRRAARLQEAHEVSEVARRLVELKEESRMTWRKIAEESGVAETQLFSTARGGSVPNDDTKAALAKYFSTILKRPVTL